jgi:hypothetical protein
MAFGRSGHRGRETMHKRIGLILVLTVVLVGSSVGPGQAWHRPYRFRPPGVVIVPRVVVPVAPWWYPYPPVVIDAYPRVVERLPPIALPQSPPPSWYFCDNPPGLLPVCPTVPWGVEAGAGHTSTITIGRIEIWLSHGSCCCRC